MRTNKKILLSLSCCTILCTSNIFAKEDALIKDLDNTISNSNVNINKNTNDTSDIIIKKIDTNGLHTYSINYILDVLDIPYNKPLQPILVRQKIETLLKTNKFEYIKMAYVGDTLKLDFKEYNKIMKVIYNFEDNNSTDFEDEDSERMEELVKIKPGMVFVSKEKDTYIKNINSFLVNRGYSNFKFSLSEKTLDNGTAIININFKSLKKPLIKKVNFKGSSKKDLSQSDLEYSLMNRPLESFSWMWGRSEGDFDRYIANNIEPKRIKNEYLKKGYLDVEVSQPNILEDTDGITLEFDIKEGTKYILSSFVINGLPENENIKKELDRQDILFINEDFKHSNIKDFTTYLDRTLKTEGYAYPTIETLFKKEGNKAKLIFNVIPGNIFTVNDILIKGNTKTNDNVIRRSLYLLPGQQFNLIDYEDSINFLNRQGYFENANIKINKVSENKIDLLVDVKETKTGSISIGGGYGSYEGFIFDSSFGERNFLGTGYNLFSNISKSEKDINYNIGVLNPGIFDSHISGSVNVQNSDTEAVYSNYEIDKNKIGFSLGLGYKWNRYVDLGISLTNLNIEDNYLFSDGSSQTEKYITQSITPSFKFNNTDNYYTPRKGWDISAGIEFAGFGGDSKYAKTNLQVKYFKDLTRWFNYDFIFRNKTIVKTLHDLGNLSPSESLSLGGVNSVRGYQSYAFSNLNINDPILNMYTTNATELSFNISNSMKLRGFGFFDIGLLGHNDFNKYQKMGVGAGLEWISPIGPIKLVYSQPINPNDNDKTSNFEIQIGSSF